MAYTAWFQKYGYNTDPLSIKPSTQLVSREKELQILRENMVSGNIVLLQGETGIGKTSLLLAVQEAFKDTEEFKVYVVSMLEGFDRLKKLCSNSPLIESLLLMLGFKKKKKIVLLIDESQLLLFNQAELIRNLFDRDIIYSLVLSSVGKNNLNVSLGFRQRIAEQIVLSKLSSNELKELLKLRLFGVNPLLEETVEYLAKISEGNPRQFLIGCKKVCIKVFEFFQTGNSIDFDTAKQIVVKKFDNEVEEKKSGVQATNILENLTPLQKAILEQLNQASMSLRELSEATGSSIGTIGKQISVLSLKTKKEYMARKGVLIPLINKDKNNVITTYNLTESAKKLLNNKL